MRRSSRWTVGLLVLRHARCRPRRFGQGFEFERAGQYDQAAAIYLATLRADPTNLTALLGSSACCRRSIAWASCCRRPSGRRPRVRPTWRCGSAAPHVRGPERARQRSGGGAAVDRGRAERRGPVPRVGDGARGRAPPRRGARRAPRRPPRARPIGRVRIELAELNRLSGDWEGAAREWAAALPDAPRQLANARARCRGPDAQRERIAPCSPRGPRRRSRDDWRASCCWAGGRRCAMGRVRAEASATSSADAAIRGAALRRPRGRPQHARRGAACALSRSRVTPTWP